uniref:Uncharacterized protein n=1 Tax=Promethearchaeum syntrophicum TaxID=2594042 RepID=A0A5B9D903_9ARCH|nr:hypothetical protein DSAG12_01311 [Candidatus Prometheoarchaeum syntrophicum]
MANEIENDEEIEKVFYPKPDRDNLKRIILPK